MVGANGGDEDRGTGEGYQIRCWPLKGFWIYLLERGEPSTGFDLYIKRIILLLWGTKKGSRRRFRRYHLGLGKRVDQMVGFGRWVLRVDSGSIFLVSLTRCGKQQRIGIVF